MGFVFAGVYDNHISLHIVGFYTSGPALEGDAKEK